MSDHYALGDAVLTPGGRPGQVVSIQMAAPMLYLVRLKEIVWSDGRPVTVWLYEDEVRRAPVEQDDG